MSNVFKKVKVVGVFIALTQGTGRMGRVMSRGGHRTSRVEGEQGGVGMSD